MSKAMKVWALPFGPGFRLRRNHAYGAFPPFGFNPITQGGGGGHFAASPTRLSGAVSGPVLVATAGPDEVVGLSVRFDRQADQCREARTARLTTRGVTQRPASDLPATPNSAAPAKVSRDRAHHRPRWR